MVLSMKESGIMDMPLEMENSIMLMETSMRDNGLITKLMVTVSIQMSKELDMKDIGKKINNMEKALRRGLKARNMRVYILTERKKVLENISGLMVQSTRVNGLITELMERESIYGRMVENITENGKIMTWKV